MSKWNSKKLHKENAEPHGIGQKLRSQKGESIAEVLVAALVVALGALLLVSMVIAAQRIIRNSEESYRKNMAVSNALESGVVDDDAKAEGVSIAEGTVEMTGTTLQSRNAVVSISGQSQNVVATEEFKQTVQSLKTKVSMVKLDDTVLRYTTLSGS